MSRASPLCLVAVAALLMGPSVKCSGPPPSPDLVQELVITPGYLEPHTPGSGDPLELPVNAAVEALLGAAPDLNRVATVRTRIDEPAGTPPSAILVLIPGFLGGATNFDPLARDLVDRFDGDLEVWAVDRRPNQLEDRLGAELAAAGATDPACAPPDPEPECSIFQGLQYYVADTDVDPVGDFPGPGDLDIDLDGNLDPQLALAPPGGSPRGPILFEQSDLPFMAYWGLDTYFRDWKTLLDEARGIVGEDGLVLLGGHSLGTTLASTLAAYDFDPDPGFVVAGHSLIDGLVLLEGGGVGPGFDTKPTLAEYDQNLSDMLAGDVDVFLESLGPIALQLLGQVGETSSLAAFYHPFEPSLVQRTPAVASGQLSLVLGAPATNRAAVGFFLDDDFALFESFRASLGFSDDGANFLLGPPTFPAIFYLAQPNAGLRTWKSFDDPTLPTCPPNVENLTPGCAILDNGAPSDPSDPAAPPVVNGLEREVTSIDTFARTQFGKANGFEWYFAAGRPSFDQRYGNDSSTLVAEHLSSVDPNHEGPLVVTQNASMERPVLAIGGTNGLTPEPKSFDRYLSSIATPPSQQEVHLIPGYAHLDVVTASDNEVVPLVEGFIVRVRQQKLLDSF